MKITKLKKLLRLKKHKRGLEEDRIFKEGELSGALKEREKINQEREIENKNLKELEVMSRKQQSDAVDLANMKILNKIKSEREGLAKTLADFNELDKIENKPHQEKIEQLRQNLIDAEDDCREEIYRWHDMINKTEDLVGQIRLIYIEFEPLLERTLKDAALLVAKQESLKEAYRLMKSLKRKVERSGPQKKIPQLK